MEVPLDVVNEIADFLYLGEVVNMRLVCREWRNINQNISYRVVKELEGLVEDVSGFLKLLEECRGEITGNFERNLIFCIYTKIYPYNFRQVYKIVGYLQDDYYQDIGLVFNHRKGSFVVYSVGIPKKWGFRWQNGMGKVFYY